VALAAADQLISVLFVGLPALPAITSALKLRAERVKLSDVASVDVYLPVKAKRESERETEREEVPVASSPLTPVVLYVHGGAWGAGDAWNFAPIARALSATYASSPVLILNYKACQYPRGDARDQATSVADALSYARTRFKGRNVICMAHSSGAHVATLALLGIHDARLQGRGNCLPLCDVFIAQAGVYDLASHYLYESSRGVALVSPLLPAACGDGLPDPVAFDTLSPLWHVTREDICLKTNVDLCQHGLQLEGASSAHFLESALRSTVDSGVLPTDCEGNMHTPERRTKERTANDSPYPTYFPLTYIQAAVSDNVVPTTGALRFFAGLQKCGVDASLLLYEGEMGHGEFVTDWLCVNGRPARELRRAMLDVKPADRAGRQRVDRHVFGRDACTAERLDDEFQFGPAAHARDVVRIVRALNR
jgi:acetyl esterase/lipase